MKAIRLIAVFTAICLPLTFFPSAHAKAKPKAFNGKTCTIVGTSKSDKLTGTSKADVICGLGGKDTINGQGGNDTIDAVPGRGGGFSLETPEGLRFIIRSRIFTDEEWLILKDEKVHLGNGELVLVG